MARAAGRGRATRGQAPEVTGPVDTDAILAEVRARVRDKRDRGIYGADVEAALASPLPGGAALLTDELAEPLPALAGVLEEDVEYDPRSRRPVIGAAITLARRLVIGLARWWIAAALERQERLNRLFAASLAQLAERPAPAVEARLARIERERTDEVAADLHSVYFAARFSGDEPVIRAQSERFLDLFRGRSRVLDLGSGRGTFLQLMREHGIGAYGVDPDRRMVEPCAAAGLDVIEAEGLAHLRSLPDHSVDGLYARHVAEHVLPGQLVAILRECRRVLRPGSPIVFVTPNIRTLTVGAHTFWLDPSHRRPIPPDLFHFYLEVEGFVQVAVVTFEPTATHLSEDVPEGAQRENVRLLNETLFGDRDYAVIGRQPA